MNRTLGGLLGCAVIVSTANLAAAQGMTIRGTRPPAITAELAPWYVNGTPITFAGHFYYPAGPRVHFLPFEMVRSGDFLGIPLYSRTTIEPYSMIFVPVGGGMMQPFERRREGELAGTAGSSAPSFPVALGSDSGLDNVAYGPTAAAPPFVELADDFQADISRPVSTAGYRTGFDDTNANVNLGELAARARPFAPRPDSPNAIFIDYSEGRWFSSGPPVPYDPARFIPAGERNGFPVYRDRAGDPLTVYVPVVIGGSAVAPYSRRR
jgi:hypothetical protein